MLEEQVLYKDEEQGKLTEELEKVKKKEKESRIAMN
jgi:hypothetical protein